MRLPGVVLCLILSFSASAGNTIIGGAITWKRLAGGAFVFELKVYRECGPNSTGFSANTYIHTVGNIFNIPVQLQGVSEIAPDCQGNQMACNTSSFGAIEEGVYASAPFQLQGTPPPAGWVFYWAPGHNDTCLSSLENVQVFYLPREVWSQAVMYPGGFSSSPRFLFEPSLVYLSNINNGINLLAESEDYEDSLHYKFISGNVVNGGPSNTITYKPGFFATSPFPSGLSDTINGPNALDGNTGMVSYDIVRANEGAYYMRMAVEQWNNGVLKSIISVNRDVFYMSDSVNTRPSAYIDTSSVNKLSQVSPLIYKATVLQGDTLSFDIKATDIDINQSTLLPQSITFNAFGSRLDNTWNAQAALGGASITPVAPQSGFASLLNNNVNFKWIPKWSDVKSSPHYFVFSFKDDKCPYPGVTYLSLEVEVERASQPTDSLGPIDINVDAGQVGVDELLNTNVEVYPNPANDLITLSGFETEGQVQLLDIQGRLLRSYQVSSESLMIKREGLSSGVYFLNISVGTKTEVKKVIFK